MSEFAVSSEARPGRLALLVNPWVLALFALAACWLLFFDELRDEWQINPQYGFGYLVPLLAGILVWRRWPERPAVQAAQRSATRRAAAAFAAALLLLLLPLRVALEANPEWRLLYWLHGLQMVALSLVLVHWAGGWSWVRFFWPPILFALIAVPWPMQLEQSCIQNLMRFVAGLTVSTADLLSIPAVQHGNLVEVGAGTVGIDEACSGVRSLQSALMLSLFLGEMYWFSLPRRAVLLSGSLVFVLLANLARTTLLVWAAATRGLHQMEAWHDTAGNLVMAIVLPGLVLLAYFMKPKGPRTVASANAASTTVPAIPQWVGLTTLAWLGVVTLATEAWYRNHESGLVENPRWSISWPEQSPQFKKVEVPERSLAILRCSNSESGSWTDDGGNRWDGFFLRWAPGRNSAQLAKGHRPDICLPATGAILLEDFGPVTVSVDSLGLSFQHQSFLTGPNVVHVFYCLWPDRRSPSETPLVEDGSEFSRLLAVLAGKRHLGQQALELSVHGAESKDEAISLLRRQLPALVRRDPPGSVTRTQ